MARIAPSILSADFSNLTTALNQCESGGADYIHVDVMDGHFVPNLTMGPVVLKGIRKSTPLPLDVHLMIEDPGRYLPEFVRAGADYVTVHVEACQDLPGTIDLIKRLGAKPGITLRPRTPLSAIEGVLDRVDLVLIMSVEPGFGGQVFIPESLNRIRQMRKMLQSASLDRRPLISVDGGIKLDNAADVTNAGADVLVVGSGIFESTDPVVTMKLLRKIT